MASAERHAVGVSKKILVGKIRRGEIPVTVEAISKFNKHFNKQDIEEVQEKVYGRD